MFGVPLQAADQRIPPKGGTPNNPIALQAPDARDKRIRILSANLDPRNFDFNIRQRDDQRVFAGRNGRQRKFTLFVERR